MKKRFTALILVLLIAFAATGCNLFVRNDERDRNQIIAVVNPITFTWNEMEGSESVEKTYVSEKYIIRKIDLMEYFVMNNGNSQIQQGTPAADVWNQYLNTMIDRKILVEAAIAKMKEGELLVFNRGKSDPTDPTNPEKNEIKHYDLADSITDMNNIWRNTYRVIDNQIFLTGNSMLSNLGEPERTKIETAEEASTTYPIMPSFVTEETPDFEDEEEFSPMEASPPKKDDWLMLEACATFVRGLITRADGSALTSAEKTRLNEDRKLLDEYLAMKNGKYELYLNLGKFFVIEKYIYNDQRDYQLLTRLQQYIFENTTVTTTEVLNEHKDRVDVQRNNFQDLTAFESALDGTDPVLYVPSNAQGYFYVKQVLIPFSAEDTAELEAFAKSPFYTAAALEQKRLQKAANLTCRTHLSGEFEGPEISFMSAYADIVSAVGDVLTPTANNRFATTRGSQDNYSRERAFISMIYKYNTDPGAFDSQIGYLIKPSGNQWVEEFTEGARKTQKQGLGALSEPILTNYGYHILYYTKNIAPTSENGISAYEYLTEGKTVRIYDVIEQALRERKQTENYNTFTNTMFENIKNDNKTIVKYESRYKDLLG